MIVAIHQPNYLPWLGFFNKMAACDTFVILDNVQHSKSSITNRNNIKTSQGEVKLTIPIKNKEKPINTLLIDEPAKNLLKHWRVIESNYSKADHWKTYAEALGNIYKTPYNLLADLNIDIITYLKNVLEINCKLVIASDLQNIDGVGSDRNLSICKALNASSYLSGNGAKAYNDEESFSQAGIRLVYNNYSYKPYKQLWGEFIPNLAAIDALFNIGPETKNLIL